jgi:hypothetical protein
VDGLFSNAGPDGAGYFRVIFLVIRANHSSRQHRSTPVRNRSIICSAFVSINPKRGDSIFFLICLKVNLHRKVHDVSIMETTVIYRCPNTGRTAEATIDPSTNDVRQYHPHFCPACRKIHLINRVTGKLLCDKILAETASVH